MIETVGGADGHSSLRSKSAKELLDMVTLLLMISIMDLNFTLQHDDILTNAGDGFIYTVQLVNNNNTAQR